VVVTNGFLKSNTVFVTVFAINLKFAVSGKIELLLQLVP
jgi:hypothetical protein